MTKDEAIKLGLALDESEADLVMIQHRLFRVREALQRIAGQPIGFQYNQPNERTCTCLIPSMPSSAAGCPVHDDRTKASNSTATR